MLKVLLSDGQVRNVQDLADWRVSADAVWIDLHHPTPEEEGAVEAAIGEAVPTRADMAQIETSSRLYRHGKTSVMTVLLVKGEEEGAVSNMPLTFVLTDQVLVTVRYHHPKSFDAYVDEAARELRACSGPPAVLLGLLEAIVARNADRLEAISAHVESLGQAILRQPRNRAFEPILRRLGKSQTANARIRDSLVSLGRLLGFAALIPVMADDAARERIATLQRDVVALTDHATYVTENINFLLDAAVGLITTQQNAIMKIFSVAAVVFMPPTLIGSIYGMNFTHMPELAWKLGYPWALGLMAASAIVPLIWFIRRGWL